jgi:hypothetical protein
MGWSHYDFGSVHFTVDCHGGDKEREQEALYRACCHQLNDAIRQIIADPAYDSLHPEFWDEKPES